MPRTQILIADDEAHVRNLVRIKLEGHGYAVAVAIDGQEAYEMALDVNPELVITDLQMPQMTGYELCLKLRETPRLTNVLAIMLTSRGDLLTDQQRSAAGIVQLVEKPFSPRQILLLVQSLKPLAAA